MQPSLIYLTLVGTWSALNTIEILGSVRLQSGIGRLLEIEGPDFIGLEELTCRYQVANTVSNVFNLGRYLVSAEHYRNLRVRAFTD